MDAAAGVGDGVLKAWRGWEQKCNETRGVDDEVRN